MRIAKTKNREYFCLWSWTLTIWTRRIIFSRWSIIHYDLVYMCALEIPMALYWWPILLVATIWLLFHVVESLLLCTFDLECTFTIFAPFTFRMSRNPFQCVDKSRLNFADANVFRIKIWIYRAKTTIKKNSRIITLFRFTLIHSVDVYSISEQRSYDETKSTHKITKFGRNSLWRTRTYPYTNIDVQKSCRFWIKITRVKLIKLTTLKGYEK